MKKKENIQNPVKKILCIKNILKQINYQIIDSSQLNYLSKQNNDKNSYINNTSNNHFSNNFINIYLNTNNNYDNNFNNNYNINYNY